MSLQIIQIAAVVVSAIIAVVWFLNRRRRRKLLQRVRADWGRVRTVPPVDWSYLLELRDVAPGGIDPQTWADLDLDQILPAIDRTETWLGRWRLLRQLSEHRSWVDIPDAERLADEFGTNPERRDTVGLELALAGSSVGSGLDVLTNPDVVRLRWWYWGFPLVPLVMLTSIALLPFHPKLLLVVAAVGAANFAIRALTARQLLGVLYPMRQLGPALGLCHRLIALLPGGSPVPRPRRAISSSCGCSNGWRRGSVAIRPPKASLSPESGNSSTRSSCSMPMRCW